MRWNPLQHFATPEGFLDGLFGGGGGGTQTSTTNTTLMYDPEEAKRRTALMDEAQRIYAGTRDQVATLAPTGPSADTLKSMDMARALAAGPMSDITGQLPGALNFGFSQVLDPTNTPGFQATLDTALRRVGSAYTDPGGVLSQIRTNAGTGDVGGTSTRQGIAEGIAGREYLNTVGDVTGKLTSDAYSKGLDTYARTLALTPSIMQSMTTPTNIESSVGAQTEGYQEQQRQWQMNAPWAALGPYANVVQGMANPSTQSTATYPAPQKNLLGQAAGGATIGYMIGGPIGAAAGGLLGLFS